MVFFPSSYAACKAGLVNRMSTGDSCLTEKLAKMYEVDLAHVQSLDKWCSVEDGRAVAIVQSGNRFLDLFVFTLPWNGGTKTGPCNYASALTRPRQLQRKLAMDENTCMSYAQSM